jgi:hypothetical protein
MNEIIIQNFLNETEEYLRTNQQQLTKSELDHITELYEDLNNELARQEMRDDLHS